MSVQTPSARLDNVTGALREVVASFASVADTDTWATGLGVIEAVNVNTHNKANTLGATFSGGTVTFANSGSAVACDVVVWGF